MLNVTTNKWQGKCLNPQSDSGVHQLNHYTIKALTKGSQWRIFIFTSKLSYTDKKKIVFAQPLPNFIIEVSFTKRIQVTERQK